MATGPKIVSIFPNQVLPFQKIIATKETYVAKPLACKSPIIGNDNFFILIRYYRPQFQDITLSIYFCIKAFVLEVRGRSNASWGFTQQYSEASSPSVTLLLSVLHTKSINM
jgi:hypothetical protein